MKKQLNEKGSTLLMVIIMSAVLTILGTAMLSMTFMNINMKYNDSRAKRSMYYSESGIDEAYALVGSFVEDTLAIAKDNTDAYREALIAYLETTVERTVDPLIPPDYPGQVHVQIDLINGVYSCVQGPIKNEDGSLVQFYMDGDGFTPEDMQLDVQALSKQLDYQFKIEFMKAFNEKYNVASEHDASFLKIVYDINEVDGLDYNGNPSDVEVLGTITPFDLSSDTPFIVHNVNSKFVYENRTEKNIQVDLVIHAPESLYPVKVTDNTIKIEDNPIWQNALVSNTDIIFLDGTDSTVNGDIYALGSFKNEITGEPKYNESGIMIGGDVLVYGDLVTRAYVQTIEDSASLTVYDGQVYCNTLSTTAGSDNSMIDIMNGNLYTKDDIELNAAGSSIRIEGSYYGISDGSTPDYPIEDEDVDEDSQIKHDNSSAIVINAPLTDASLYISGDMPDFETLELVDFWYNPYLWMLNEENPTEINKNKFDESLDGVWIPGTAYIQIGGTGNADYWPYQTGESVSVKENYLAYSLPMYLGDLHQYSDTNIYKETANNGAEMVFGTTVSDEGEPLEEVKYFDFADKAEYLIEISNYPEYMEDASLINIGNVSSININKYKYGVGTIISNDGSINELKAGPSDPSDFVNISREIRYDFISYLLHSVRNKEAVEDIDLEHVYYFPDSDFNIIVDHVDYTTTTLYSTSIEEYVYATELEQVASQILYVSNPDSEVKENVRLVGVGGVAADGYTNIETEDGATEGYFQGIIITQGDVIIDGDVHFTGSIIAGGKIEVRGGDSEFHNSEEKSVKYIARLIKNNVELRRLLLKGAISGNMLVFNMPNDVGNVNDSNLKHAFKDLVDINNWKIN